MNNLQINMMIDVAALQWKIDTEGIKNLVLANVDAAASIVQETGVMLICRKNWEFKQFDHWHKKGVAFYNVIIPYEKALSDDTGKEELTRLCADLVIECLLFWAEKKRKKLEKTRAKAA